MANPLFQQHFISVSDCSSDMLDYLLQTAMRLKKTPQPHLLDGKLIASCFFEPSTRTRLSFETAVQRLGGKVIGFADGASTSAKKGETLADTARIISNYADAVIIRHPKDGAARVVGDFANVPVVNAGDGTNQHPTQTLLDLLTTFETQGRIDNLNIAMIGDLKYGRTVHSLAQALSLRHNSFAFVSPAELAMPDYICEQLDEAGAPYRACGSIEEIIDWADIVYMTRIQRERFDEQEFARIRGHFNLNAAMLTPAKENMRILHPLPRVDEISPDVDGSLHACYFQQAANGLFARQAVLASILNERP